MVMANKKGRGVRIDVRAAVTVADGRAFLDALSEAIDRLDQGELEATTTDLLRELLGTAQARAERPATPPKSRNDSPPAGGAGRLLATLRAFAARLDRADGAERDAVVREFGRWVECGCGSRA